jgi:hypothetical protein
VVFGGGRLGRVDPGERAGRGRSPATGWSGSADGWFVGVNFAVELGRGGWLDAT